MVKRLSGTEATGFAVRAGWELGCLLGGLGRFLAVRAVGKKMPPLLGGGWSLRRAWPANIWSLLRKDSQVGVGYTGRYPTIGLTYVKTFPIFLNGKVRRYGLRAGIGFGK